MYSKKDLEDAAAFRGVIHREALERLRRFDPSITAVDDRARTVMIHAVVDGRRDYLNLI